MIPNYPIEDGHRLQYVLYPVCKDGKWRAAEVVTGGYLNPFDNPAKVDFNTERGCRLACGIHNKYLGLSLEEIEKIISLSMSSPNNKEDKAI